MVEGRNIPSIEAQNVERIDLLTLRLITYTPRAGVQRWITEELAGMSCALHFASSLHAAFEALGEEFRRRVIIVDYDALSKEELV